MKKYSTLTALSIAVVLLVGVGVASAQTPASPTLQQQIQTLLARIAELQAQLKSVQGQVDDLIKAGLTEGMTDNEIKEIQELLATDPTIYPSGLTTGYFGPMTREAIKRFQEKFGLEVTGTLNEETRQALTEVRKERREKGIQTGLLRSEEVRQRIKMRLKDKWENCDYVRPGKEAFCKDKKDKSDDDDMKDDDDDMDDSDDDSDDRDVSRDDARRAVVDAQNELNRFRADLEDLDGDELDEAKDVMKDAQAEMSKARRALARQEFDDAFESAEKVIKILEGDDSEDDDEDDDSEDEDEDDDSDDEDEDDDEDDD